MRSFVSIRSFIDSLTGYILSRYYVPSLVLGTGHSLVTETEEGPALLELAFMFPLFHTQFVWAALYEAQTN